MVAYKNLKKIKCFWLDLPIILVTVILGILITVHKISDTDITIVENIFFPILSIFANLMVCKMIQLIISMGNVQFSKEHIAVMIISFLGISVYYIYSLYTRKFIYYWDYSCYLNMQYEIEKVFADNIISGIFKLIESIPYDYTYFLCILMEFPFCLTAKTGDWYVAVQLINIYPVLIILFNVLVIKIMGIYKTNNKHIYVICMASIISLPVIYKAALLGMPDIIGLIFCIMIVCITIDYHFDRTDIVQNILLIICTISLMLIRRWYLYFIVGYYIMYALRCIYELRKESRCNIIRRICYIAAVCTCALIIITVICLPMIKHIISYNYGERYAAYMDGGIGAELCSQVQYMGLVFCALIFAGFIIACIKNKEYVWLYIESAMGFFISVFVFTRVQNMSRHHLLLLIPFIIVLLIISTIEVLQTVNRVGKYWLSVIICVNVVLGTINNFTTIRLLPNLTPDFNCIVKGRNDYDELKIVADWIDKNVSDGEHCYIIPRCDEYNPDIIRNIYLPRVGLREKIPYGSGVLGTHWFPTDIFDAKYVVTCNPFPYKKSAQMALRYNELFNTISLPRFSCVKTFNMNNGTIFYVYERISPADKEEIEAYLSSLSEENEKFPEMFGEHLDRYMSENNIL